MPVSSNILIGIAIKVLITALTVVSLILVNPSYITSYITINYDIVIIYVVSGLTLLYCIGSLVVYFISTKRQGRKDFLTTNCGITEAILSAAGCMGWLIVAGFSGTVSQRTSTDSGDGFGWMSLIAGLNSLCFLTCAAIFIFGICQGKFLGESQNGMGMQDGSSRQHYDGRGYKHEQI